MGEKKKQNIVVFTTLSPADKNLILNGIKLTSVFNKELCLVYHLKKQEKQDHDFIRQKLLDYTIPLKKEIPDLKTSVLVLENRLYDLPDILADEYEAILLIADNSQFKKYSKAVTESPVPFLFINPGTDLSSFRKIIMPVDLRRENSDTSLWCSWFGRFNQSEIVVVAANEKRKDFQKLVNRNILLAKKLFLKFNISHKIYKGRKKSLQNSFEAMEFALSSEADLIVLLGSSVITPLDWIVGLPERKIIRNAGNLPVLLVNPRRDNYILCD